MRNAARTASNSRIVEPVSDCSGVNIPLHNSTMGPWARHWLWAVSFRKILEVPSDTCAPHAYFDASVTMFIFNVCSFSGGNQDLPSSWRGILVQKWVNSAIDLLDNFTEVLGNQPYFEFKSAYKWVRWNLPFGSAKHVLYKYPMHYAKRRFLTNRLRRFAYFKIVVDRKVNFSRYFGDNLNKCYGTYKKNPRC